MDEKTNGRENEFFVAQNRAESTWKRQCAQLIATGAFGLMVLSVGTLITVPTVLNGALYDKTDDTNVTHNSTLYATTEPHVRSTTPQQWPNVSNIILFDNATTETADLKLTKYQSTLLGSLVFLVQPVGSIVSGFIQGHMGRRNGMMATSVVQCVGWISLYFSFNIPSLFSAAVLMGLSIGFMEAPGLSFLGEVIEPRYRGCFANIAMNMWLFGVLFEYLLGALMSWRYVCLCSAAVPIVNFIALSFIPESPTFLLLQGKERQAEAALRWLRGWTHHETIRDEYEALVESLNIPHKHNTYLSPTAQHGKNLPGKSSRSQLTMLMERRVRFPLLMIALLFLTQHAIALQGIKPFLVSILNSLNFDMDSFVVLVCSSLLQLVGVLICAVSVRYAGKRVMLLLSSSLSTVVCILLAIYMHVEPGMPIIAIVLFAVNFFTNGLGIMSLPWCLVAEVFPTECRGSAAGIAAASSYILGSLATLTYKSLESAVSLSGCLLIYAAIGVIGTSVTYFKLPETEGKTLDQIQQLFRKQTQDGHVKPPKGHNY